MITSRSRLSALAHSIPLFAAVASCLFSLPGCSQSPTKPEARRDIAASSSVSSSLSRDRIKIFASRDGLGGSGPHLAWMKFVVLPDAGGRPQGILFQNSDVYPFHAEALRENVPGFEGMTPARLDPISLRSAGRKVFLGVVFFRSGFARSNDQIGGADPFMIDYQVLSRDPLDVGDLAAIQRLVKGGLADIADIRYYPYQNQRAELESRSEAIRSAGIRLVPRDELSRTAVYSNGWALGRVRVMDAAAVQAAQASGDFDPNDVLVLQELPRELPPVGAVVTSSESSPGSHVALLMQMSSSPMIFDPAAFASRRWRDLEGKRVVVTARGALPGDGGSEYAVQDASVMSEAQVANLRALKRVQVSAQPRLDSTETRFPAIDELSQADVPRFGAKASNLGFMRRLLPTEHTPAGFAIPVGYSRRFLESVPAPSAEAGTLRDWIDRGIRRIGEPGTSPAAVRDTLKAVRDAIKAAPIPPAMIGAIRSAVSASFPDPTKPVRLRSSSNVEDLKEFNGAGLYDSTSVCLADEGAAAGPSACDPSDDRKPLEKGLKKVWASLYSEAGFVARRRFGIAEDSIAMGVLVSLTENAEKANGVAILEYGPSQFDPTEIEATMHMTGFPGEDLEVAHPPVGKAPESMFVSRYGSRLQRASTEVEGGRTLLPPELYTQAYQLAQQVARAWPRGQSDQGRLILDFEWKWVGDRIVYKQVRELPVLRRATTHDPMLIGMTGLKLRIPRDGRVSPVSSMALPTEIALDSVSIRRSAFDAGTSPFRRAALAFADGTRVELGPEKLIARGGKLMILIDRVPGLTLIPESWPDSDPVAPVVSMQFRVELDVARVPGGRQIELSREAQRVFSGENVLGQTATSVSGDAPQPVAGSQRTLVSFVFRNARTGWRIQLSGSYCKEALCDPRAVWLLAVHLKGPRGELITLPGHAATYALDDHATNWSFLVNLGRAGRRALGSDFVFLGESAPGLEGFSGAGVFFFDRGGTARFDRSWKMDPPPALSNPVFSGAG